MVSKELELERMRSEFEKGIVVIGASALEDELQEEVAECIAEMLIAGIKVWMITGDKLETAENIGTSCQLFNTHSSIFRLIDSDEESIAMKFKLIKEYFNKSQGELPSDQNLDLWFSKSKDSNSLTESTKIA